MIRNVSTVFVGFCSSSVLAFTTILFCAWIHWSHIQIFWKTPWLSNDRVYKSLFMMVNLVLNLSSLLVMILERMRKGGECHFSLQSWIYKRLDRWEHQCGWPKICGSPGFIVSFQLPYTFRHGYFVEML